MLLKSQKFMFETFVTFRISSITWRKWSPTVWWRSLKWKATRPGRFTLMTLPRKLWMNLQCAMELNIFIKLWREYHHGCLPALLATMCLREITHSRPLWFYSPFLFHSWLKILIIFVHLILTEVLLVCSGFKI